MRKKREKYFTAEKPSLSQMQHKGEIVERAIRQSGYSITKLAKKLRRSRRWMYHVFENSNVPVDVILEIGKFIHHDFSDEVRELKKYKAQTTAERAFKEGSSSYRKVEKESEHWKNKYLELLEEHKQLLAKIAKTKKAKSGRAKK